MSARHKLTIAIEGALTPADVALMRQVETAYRRGYAQGASVAVDQLADGYALDRLRRWVRDVQRWRSALAHTGTPESFEGWKCPPELPQRRVKP